MTQSKKTVIITGSASGMGEATARRLAGEGYRVFGGDLEPTETGVTGFTRHRLDVRDDALIEAFFAEVFEELERTGSTLDVLINCAGFALAGAIEEATLEEAKAQFETNFFGVARMVKAALPAMRRQGHGRIINISSGAAQVAEPYAGYYSATKFAVEGYTEALRMEVAEFGIDACIVVPGWTKTGILRHMKNPEHALPAYAGTRARVTSAVEGFVAEAPPPEDVAETVLRVVRAVRPSLRTRTGKDVKSSFWVKRLLPAGLYEKLVRDYYQLRAPKGEVAKLPAPKKES